MKDDDENASATPYKVPPFPFHRFSTLEISPGVNARTDGSSSSSNCNLMINSFLFQFCVCILWGSANKKHNIF